ncbi:tetratricopeptide repeat protein [Mycobacterium sp.]|uniref:tetratricopeptide repeat protein n=1 Tax=Mycobacterium sp. TaxID=1785 RepID=UPI00257A69F0|nr:tetratricopeptide repeat protein [Mycobacterium sp.]
MTQSGPDPVAEAVAVADAYIESKNYQRARDVLRQVLAEHPNDPVVLAHYAQAELMLGNHAQAAASAYAALSAAPHNEHAMRIYALALDGQGQGQEALRMARRTVTEHPNEPLAYRLLALVLKKARHCEEALVAVDEALRLAPADVDGLILRGSILYDLDLVRQSNAAYRQALSLDPDNAEATHNLAVNRLSSGRLTRSMRGLLGAGAMDPALGDLLRRNIGAVIVRAARRVTVLAVVLGVLMAVVWSLQHDGHSAAVPRVLIGVVIVVVLAMVGWFFRPVPRGVWATVLRQRGFLAVRLVYAFLTVLLAAWVAAFGGADLISKSGVLLAVVGVIVAWVGLMTGS